MREAGENSKAASGRDVDGLADERAFADTRLSPDQNRAAGSVLRLLETPRERCDLGRTADDDRAQQLATRPRSVRPRDELWRWRWLGRRASRSPAHAPCTDGLGHALEVERSAFGHRKRRAGADEPAKRVADDQLLRAGLARQPARDVDRAPHELVVVCNGLSCVEADADPQLRGRILSVSHIGGTEDRDGALERDGRGVEDHIEGIAFGLDLGTFMPRDLSAHERAVVTQEARRGSIALGFDEAGVVPKVREQERSGERGRRLLPLRAGRLTWRHRA